jgi:hypothetical protein
VVKTLILSFKWLKLKFFALIRLYFIENELFEIIVVLYIKFNIPLTFLC